MPYIIAVLAFVFVGGAYLLFFPESSEPEKNTSTIIEQPVVVAKTEQEVEPVPVIETTPKEPEPDPVAEQTVQEPETVPVIETAQEDSESTTLEIVSGTVVYPVPRGHTHDLQISLTLEGDTIVAATMNHDGTGVGVTKSHINFDAAYEKFVIGANINTISLSRVGGASQTSEAFNDLIEEIRVEIQDAV